MSRPSNKEPKRKQIAWALLRVIGKKGYDSASIGDIADEAGLTKGLIHYYFKSKDEILVAALKELVADYDTRLEKRIQSSWNTPLEHLDAFIDYHLALGEDARPDILGVWIVITGEALRKDEVNREYRKAVHITKDWVEAIINSCVEEKSAACEDPEAAATAIVAAIQGYFVLAATCPDLIPTGSAAKSLKQMSKGLLIPMNI